jgi:hypothetical protein
MGVLYRINEPKQQSTVNASAFNIDFLMTSRGGNSFSTTGMIEGTVRIAVTHAGTTASLYVGEVVSAIVSGAVSSTQTLTMKTQSGTYTFTVAMSAQGNYLRFTITPPNAAAAKWLIRFDGTITDAA